MPREDSQFKRGTKDKRRGRGGKRPNSGPKPDWFKKEMAKIATRPEAIKLFKDVIDGKDVDEFVTPEGVQVPVKPKAEVRLKFWERAADRGFGKVTDNVDVTSGGQTLRDILIAAINEDAGGAASSENKGES